MTRQWVKVGFVVAVLLSIIRSDERPVLLYY
jgi:hypothetical protein